MQNAEDFVKSLFKTVDIQVGGNRSWDIHVHNDALYARLIRDRSLGLGEAYMDGWWDCDAIDQFTHRLLQVNAHRKPTPSSVFLSIKSSILNLQKKSRARKVIDTHYDLSNELYFSFLDPYNQYTCSYFKNTDDLNVAQIQKMDLLCRKLKLTSQDSLLDIGCGWGGFAKFAAERYKCRVTGITLSHEQAEYAKILTKGLPVEIIEADYREYAQSGHRHSKVVVVGMLEHVGYKNYRTFFSAIDSVLKKNGLFVLHAIGSRKSRTYGEPWSHKYIFQNGMAPSVAQIGRASEHAFVLEDMQNFGPYYEQTLLAWEKNFREHWHTLSPKYPERFYRMWRYYLLSFAGSFKARRLDLNQFVFSRIGDSGGVYNAER